MSSNAVILGSDALPGFASGILCLTNIFCMLWATRCVLRQYSAALLSIIKMWQGNQGHERHMFLNKDKELVNVVMPRGCDEEIISGNDEKYAPF